MKSSAEKISANQRNSLKSTGPNDVSKTRYNAVKHGLLARCLTALDCEEKFADLLLRLDEQYRPQNVLEEHYVEQIALCLVRIRRAGYIEAQFQTSYLNPRKTKRDLSPLEERLRALEGGKEIVIDEGVPPLFGPEMVEIGLFPALRYETALENKLRKATHELDRLVASRWKDSSAPATAGAVPTTSDLALFGNPPHN